MYLSYWEKNSFSHYDCIIIGAGIVGLSAASQLKEKNPKLKIAILESGIFNLGASTKNAGFACFGSPGEILADLKLLPKDKVFELIALRQSGIHSLIKRLGKKNIGYLPTGGYELISQKQIEIIDKIETLNHWLKPLFPNKAFHILNRKNKDFPFSPQIQRLVYLPNEAQIDSGKMMFNLIQYAQKKGVMMFTGTKVIELNHETKTLKIQNTLYPHKKNYFELNAKKIIVCTNAFTSQLFPEIEIAPARGQIILTQAFSKMPFKGIFHFDEGYYYFRNIGKRVLIGGARNLDTAAETTYSLLNTKKITASLLKCLQNIILPNYDIKIEQSWAGTMAFGAYKFPYLTEIYPNIIVAAGMGGMGVAIGSEWGNRAANQILDS